MPAPTLAGTFTDRKALNKVLPHKVFSRTNWADDWSEVPHLWCNNASWALAPGTSTAELSWHYGLDQKHDEVSERVFLPDSGYRRYFKIEWFNDVNIFGDDKFRNPRWYGILNGVGCQAGGVRFSEGVPFETGGQALHLVGLEKLLEEQPIRVAAWEESGERHFVARGLTFNADRADGTQGGNLAAVPRWYRGNIPIFSGQVMDDDLFWDVETIIQYLMFFHRPTDKFNNQLPFYFVDTERLTLLPNEGLQIETHGRSLREILNQLLPYQRFLTWGIEVVDELNNILIIPYSLTGEDITLPSGHVVKANPRRWMWDIDDSRGDGVLTLSHAESVERVRVQGARATTTFTISNVDTTLVAGYSTAEKTLYDAGGESAASYAAAGVDKKTKLHLEVRAHDKLRNVYSRFKIPDTWNGVAKNGEGGVGHDAFPFVTGIGGFKFYQRELYIEPVLAFRDGYDYSVLGGSLGPRIDPVKHQNGPHNNRPPIVVIQIPATGLDATDLGTTRWVHVDHVGLASHPETVPGDASRRWSGNIFVARQDRAICVRVSGEPQWVIAGADYTRKTDGSEPICNVWDWKTIIATVTCKADLFCEGSWPPFLEIPANDYIREALLQAGDEYRLDWLVPGTMIGLTADGAIERSALGGWIQDDSTKLQNRARLAFAWYGIERRAISLPTSIIHGSILPGDFVCTAGVLIPHTLNTVVTNIRIDCPPGTESSPPPTPTMTYTTDYVPDMDLFLSPNLMASRPPAAAAALLPRVRGSDYIGGNSMKMPRYSQTDADMQTQGPASVASTRIKGTKHRIVE